MGKLYLFCKHKNAFFGKAFQRALFAALLMFCSVGVLGQTYIFNNKAWGTTTQNWTSGSDGLAYLSGRGIQITTGVTKAFGNSDKAFANISKVVVTYSTNAGSGVGTISTYATAGTAAAAQSGTLIGSASVTTTGGTTNRILTFTPGSAVTGYLQIYVICTSNSIYIYSVDITYTSGKTVTFNSNYSTPTTTTQTASTTTALTTNPFTRTGYTFANWDIDAGGAGVTTYADGASFPFTADATLFAQWTINQYNVTYSGNGNDGGTAPITQTADYNTAITLASNSGSLTKTGYTFNGWNTNAAGTGTHYNTGATFTIPAANTPLYAEWQSTAPFITNSAAALVSVNTTYGTASGNTSFTVSAGNLTANLIITAPAGFEISLSAGTGFATSLNLGTGTQTNTPIYVRLAATTAVGTYSGNISLASTATSASKATVNSTVSAKALTITGLLATDKVFDRTTTVTISGTPAYAGLVNAEAFYVTGTGTWAFADFNVGVSKALTQTGSYAAPSTNYTVTQPTLTATITAKPVTIAGATAQSKPYDGTTTATITGATLVGLISPDAYTVTGGGTFATANVGTAISVTTSLTFSGTGSTNYSLTQPTGLAANITIVAPTIITSTINITVGGTYTLAGANITSNSVGAFTYALGSATPAGSVTLTGGNTLNGIAVGTATLTVNQAANGNYAAGSMTVTVNVTTVKYVDGDYWTIGDGNWHGTAASGSPNTWQQRILGTWTTISNSPPSNAASLGTKTVYVRHKITLVGTNTAPKVVVENNGELSTSTIAATFGNLLVETGGIFNREGNGSGISGVFEVEDNATVNFYHTNATSRTSSIWAGTEKFHQNSNFVIKSGNNTANFLDIEDNADVSEYNGSCFGNLIIDLGAGKLQLLPSGFNKVLANNLIFRSTVDNIRISDGDYSFVVLNNIEIESTYGSTLTALSTAGTATINVGGNFIHNGSGTFRLANNASAIVALSVGGNLLLNSGTFDVNFTSGGISAVKLKGDLTVASSAQLFANNITTATFNFTGTGDGSTDALTQTIDVANQTTASNINFNVNSGAYAKLINQNLALGTNSSFTVKNGGVFDFGFDGVNGAGSNALNVGRVVSPTVSSGQTFTSETGSTLKMTSPQGITSYGDYTGNVKIGASSGSRNFASGLNTNYYYIGKDNQVTGNGLPTSSTLVSAPSRNVIVEMFDDALTLQASGVQRFNSSGTLEIRKGIVVDDPSNNFANSGISTENGNLKMTGGRYRLKTSGPQPDLNGTYALTGGVIEYAFTSGTSTIQSIRGGASYLYPAIEVTGKDVYHNNGNLNLKAAGSLTVKNGGILTSTANTEQIVSADIINKGTLTLENNAVFRTATVEGFYGPNKGIYPSASVRDNVNINLIAGSTINYARESSVLPSSASLGDQTITNTPVPYQNLTLSGDGIKTAPSTTLEIKGNLTKTGTATFAHNGGTVSFSGNTAQSYGVNNTMALPIMTFYNVTNTNNTVGAGLTINDSMAVVRQLSLDAAITNLNVGDIILKSSSANTANVASTATAAISYPGRGRFIIERYIPSTHTAAWQLLSTPMNGPQTIRQAWQEGFGGGATGTKPGNGTWITSTRGSGANGFDATTPGTALKSYVSSTDQWDKGPTNTDTAVTNNRGYLLFVRGDRTVTSGLVTNNTTLRTRGKLNVGPQVSIPVLANRYETIGNPYASPINVTAMRTTDFQNLTNEIYIWDPALALTGSYGVGGFRTLTYLNATLGYLITPWNGSGNYPKQYTSTLQSGQAFFVKSNGVASSSVTFTETDKSVADSSRLTNGIDPLINFSIFTVNLTTEPAPDSNLLLDGAVAIFGADYNNNVDYNDGSKFLNNTNNVGFARDGKLLAVERRQFPVEGDTLHLYLGMPKFTSYQWLFSAENMNHEGLSAFLLDRYKNTKTALNLNDSTTVDFTTDANPASSATDRFKIVFVNKAAGPLPVTITSIMAVRNVDKTIRVNWQTNNEINLQQYTIERSSNGSSFETIGKQAALNNNGGGSNYTFNDANPLATDNYYRIKSLSKDGSIQYSSIVKVAGLQLTTAISVYPNPVVNGEMSVRFVNQPIGKYGLRLMNKLGQVVYSGKVNVASEIDQQKVSIGNNVAAGSYQLFITAEDGKVTTLQVIVNHE